MTSFDWTLWDRQVGPLLDGSAFADLPRAHEPANTQDFGVLPCGRHGSFILERTPERDAQPVHGAVDHHDAEFVAEEFWRVMVMTTA